MRNGSNRTCRPTSVTGFNSMLNMPRILHRLLGSFAKALLLTIPTASPILASAMAPIAPVAFLGIDLGTTGVKALLIDEAGNALASATVEYPLYTPQPLWSEQEPADWWRGTVQAIQQ